MAVDYQNFSTMHLLVTSRLSTTIAIIHANRLHRPLL